jgi:hypothetical protein
MYVSCAPSQREVQRGTFIILCLRCSPGGLTAAQQRDVLVKLRDTTLSTRIKFLLQARQRRPIPSEFPIIAGADLVEVERAIHEACGRLEEVMQGPRETQVSCNRARSHW